MRARRANVLRYGVFRHGHVPPVTKRLYRQGLRLNQMAYQYRPKPASGPGGTPPKPKHNWVNKLTRESRTRERMLDKSKENYFKYDMEDLLKKHEVPEERRLSLAATIFAKGSRSTTQEAKDFVKEKQTEGLITEPLAKAIINLIDGYSTWR